MAKMKMYYTTTAKLSELPVVDGQIIFAPDGNLICLDMKDQRFRYQTVKIYSRDIDRLAEESPITGFYYVEDTHVVWRWDSSQWQQITPSNLAPIFYGETKRNFPQEGIEGNLYFTDKGIYNWKPQLNEYNLIANANTWGSI